MNNFVRSVKFKLTLSHAIVLMLFLSVFALLMYTELSRTLYRDVDRSLQNEAKGLEESLDSFLDGIDQGMQLAEKQTRFPNPFFVPLEVRLRLQDVINQWQQTSQRLSRSTYMIRFINLNHSILLTKLKGWEAEVIFPDFERDSVFMENGRSFLTIHFRDQPMRLYYHLVRYRNKPLFIIQVGRSTEGVKKTLHRLWILIWVLIPVAVGAAWIAGWFLARRSFNPIDTMIREARQITAAYLKGRLPRTETGDEVDRLAETLNEMMDRLEASTRTIQEFSSNISHELKTPLAIIRGEIDLALRRSRSPEDLKKSLGIIEGEVNELIRLVDDLLLLVRSDANQLRFQMEEVMLKEILIQLLERYGENCAQKQITLNHRVHGEAMVRGDRVYLKRLFSNLLDNAIKFTPGGGRITVAMNIQAESVLVTVEDTGIGIPKAAQARVFSRFYRTDQARAHEGSGLGLNIAKVIVTAHQGKISLKSREGVGTAITIEFPRL